MSEVLCQCGHAQMSHFGIVGQGSCQINVGRSRCQCVKYAPPTREPIRLTDEAEAAWQEWRNTHALPHWDGHGITEATFKAGFRAARLAGGPTLADAFRERLLTLKQDPDWQGLIVQQAIGVLGKHLDFLARTPESEDTE